MVAMRGAWLVYSLELARLRTRGHPRRLQLWYRAVRNAWLYGQRPYGTILDSLHAVPFNRIGNLNDVHWLRMWQPLGDRDEARLAMDKIASGEKIAALGARTPRQLDEIARGRAVYPATLPWGETGILFVKPRHGSRARGAMSLSKSPLRSYVVNGRRRVSEDALAAVLTRLAARDSLIVQAFCRPSAETFDLSNETCLQIRINTARYWRGDSFVAGAFVVVQPPGDHAATTLDRALAVPLDPQTGVMLSGFFTADPERHYEKVPWNGAVLSGRSMPLYQAAVEMTLAASQAFPRTPVLGWDVLITEEGPVILEANIGVGWDMVHFWHDRVGVRSSLLPAVMTWIQAKQ